MKKLQNNLWFLCLFIGYTIFAQNPFSIMAQNQPNYGISDQDIQTPPNRFTTTNDLYVYNNACIGNDCIDNGEIFGSDGLRLKENNIRIHFEDTSNSASFPNNDWRITINDFNNGGDNYFAIDDATAGTNPFRVEAGAGNNALFVSGPAGNVGLGTDTPVVELQITDGDSPTIRLEQDGSSGFTPQTWDLAGNEANFFIRDVTNASSLPFRIQPGSGTNDALMIKNNGSVGIQAGAGFSSINANASLELGANNKGLQLNRLDNTQRAALGTALGAGEVGVIVYDTDDQQLYTWDGTIWNGGTVDTDNQTADVFQLNGNNLELSLEDDGVATQTVDFSGYLDNTDDQVADVFQLNGNNLELSLEDDGVATQTVDLSGYLDNTDDQVADVFQLNGNNLELSLEDDGVATQTVDLSGYLDNTDDQVADVFQLNGNNLELSLENDGVATQTVDLSGYLDNTDDQQLTLVGNNLNLEDGGSVDLSGYLDNTDNQNISGSGLAGNILTIGISGGTSENVDLSVFNNPGTDDQQLTLAGNNLNLEDGGSVDLSGYLDNTDNQNIAGSGFAANILTIGISGGTSQSIDLSSLDDAGSDDQQLTLNGNSLDLEDGGSVDLSGYLDNTDNQSITAFNLEGNLLKLELENANIVQVDLSSILIPLEIQNANQQIQIDDLIARVEFLEACACQLPVPDVILDTNSPYLFQNVPNPFDNTTSIRYYIPFEYNTAEIVLTTPTGQILKRIPVTEVGEGIISFSRTSLSSGMYLYSLYLDGKRIDTKRMLID